MKKILALAAALVFTFSAISVSAAGNSPNGISINVDGTLASEFIMGETNNDQIYYDKTNNILTLNNASITQSVSADTDTCGLFIDGYDSELTIELIGDNYITEEADINYGILSKYTDITFTGTGTLEIAVPDNVHLFKLVDCEVIAGKDMVVKYGASKDDTEVATYTSGKTILNTDTTTFSTAKYMLMTFSNDSTSDTSSGLRTDSKAVSATYVSANDAETVYSVDISWGSLEYTYTEGSKGTWNPKTQKYEGAAEGGWSCSDGADTITITNHSNAAITASLGFTANDGYSGITGTFYDNNTVITSLSLKSAEGLTADNAPTASAKLKISGKLSESSEKQNVGSVTVSIAAK